VLPLVILFAVIAVAAGAWGVTRSQAASSATVRADALDGRLKALESELATAADKVAFAEKVAREADQRAIEQTKRAEQASQDGRRSDEMAEDAVKRAIAAERSSARAVEQAKRAEADRLEAQRDRDATLAGAGPFQPEALWQLELQRIERLWRDRLALQPHEESPLAPDSHDVGAALRILTEASREESGVVVDLMWHVDFECPPDRCVQLVRLGEELISAMRESEGGELEVIGEEDRTVFFLIRTLPPIELPERLTAVLDGFGAMREMADTTVVVRVPARDDATMAAAPAETAGAEGQEALFPDGTFDGDAPIDLRESDEASGGTPAPASEGASAPG
jgi:hypothetical protein